MCSSQLPKSSSDIVPYAEIRDLEASTWIKRNVLSGGLSKQPHYRSNTFQVKRISGQINSGQTNFSSNQLRFKSVTARSVWIKPNRIIPIRFQPSRHQWNMLPGGQSMMKNNQGNMRSPAILRWSQFNCPAWIWSHQVSCMNVTLLMQGNRCHVTVSNNVFVDTCTPWARTTNRYYVKTLITHKDKNESHRMWG